MVRGYTGTSSRRLFMKGSMMHEGRGVAAKRTEGGNEVCEHGAAAAAALRQRGEQPIP